MVKWRRCNGVWKSLIRAATAVSKVFCSKDKQFTILFMSMRPKIGSADVHILLFYFLRPSQSSLYVIEVKRQDE